jgi:hypothetical protein
MVKRHGAAVLRDYQDGVFGAPSPADRRRVPLGHPRDADAPLARWWAVP